MREKILPHKEYNKYLHNSITHYRNIGYCQFDLKMVGVKDKNNKTKNKIWFLTIIDEQTKYVYSQESLHGTKEVILEFLRDAIEDFKNVGNKIIRIRTDHAGSFNMTDFIKGNESFAKLLSDNNIRHEYSVLHHPQTNGTVERMHRTIDQEFMSQISKFCTTINEIRRKYSSYIWSYNTKRLHFNGCFKYYKEHPILKEIPYKATPIEFIKLFTKFHDVILKERQKQ